MSPICLDTGWVTPGEAPSLVPAPHGALIVLSCCAVACILYQEHGEARRGFKAGLIAAGLLVVLAAVPFKFPSEADKLAGSHRPWLCVQSLGAFTPGPVADRAHDGREPCAETLAGLLKRLWSFLISDEGHFLFGSAATLRAFFFYLRRSPLPEAHHLADTLKAGLVLLILLGLLESRSILTRGPQCREAVPVAMAAWQPPERLAIVA